MISFPNAKINLGLYITEKRKDGFHNILTGMVPFGLSDILEFVESDEDDFHCSGLETGASGRDNLVIKALHLLRAGYNIPPLSMHLHKVIPTGAGLGGGSSDAAFMLKMLDSSFSLNIGNDNLKTLASEIGSDCAFFIDNIPSIASGRGEQLEPFTGIDENLYIILLHPGFAVSTKEAYAGVVPARPGEDLRRLISLPVSDWKDRIVNQFEETVIKIHPKIRTLKELLYQAGAAYASMSGSGSSVFGVFTEKPDLKNVPTDMMIYSGRLTE